MRVYLDMDGVLVNLLYGLLKLHGREDFYPDYPNEPSVHAALGVSAIDIWGPVTAAGPAFWASLKKYPWTDELVSWARSLGAIDILTIPLDAGNTLDEPVSIEGKIRWIRKHFGPDFRRYHFTRDKTIAARPDALLIDDMDALVTSFRAAGGSAILVPQPYNSLRHSTDNVMLAVLAQFEQLQEQLYGA